MAKSPKAELGDGPAIVYPVEGAYLAGIPAVPTITDDATAARLVATGAFRYEAPAIPEDGDAPLVEVSPLPESALAALGYYHNVED